MKYESTRGKAPKLNFEEVTLAGLAEDGGLYIPETIPQFSTEKLKELSNLSYQDLALEIMLPFVEPSLTREELKTLVSESYKAFRHPEITPVTKLKDNSYLLELYHGPSLAFKDVALQFLGRLLDFLLTRRGEKIVVAGATSGDTGSAAIEGCKGQEHIELFIMHPYKRVSEVQRRQMTTIAEKNIHNLAVKGNFDDCQNLLKALFADREFVKNHKLTAVNSINWARIMAQIVYYFYSAFRIGSPEQKVSFSVPTGNFGDIFAGYIAYKMGLPIEKLIVATNKNDILARFFESGIYQKSQVIPTISPSMDIQISSNFERLLFDMCDSNGGEVESLLSEFKETGKFSVSKDRLLKVKELFASVSVNEEQTKETIANVYTSNEKLIDTHTAVGIRAGQVLADKSTPCINLATAHPAKFPDAVEDASGVRPQLPEHLANLLKREEKYDVLENELRRLKEYINSKA